MGLGFLKLGDSIDVVLCPDCPTLRFVRSFSHFLFLRHRIMCSSFSHFLFLRHQIMCCPGPYRKGSITRN